MISVSQNTKLPSENIIDYLKKCFPKTNFVADDEFLFRSSSKTVHYVQSEISSSHGLSMLMHEIAHSICSHNSSSNRNDITRLKQEIEAWSLAVEKMLELGIKPCLETAESCLEEYRELIHKRSLCKECQSVAIQSKNSSYYCINCNNNWSFKS